MRYTYPGKRVLVTGAASGIGRAVALKLAREGAVLYLTDVNADGLADTVAACKRALPAIRAHLLMSFKQDEATGHWRPTAERIAATAQACGADGVGLQGQRQVLNRGFLDRLTAGGVGEFHVWTIDAPDDARAYRDLGAMGITTNRPTVIREALEGRKE